MKRALQHGRAWSSLRRSLTACHHEFTGSWRANCIPTNATHITSCVDRSFSTSTADPSLTQSTGTNTTITPEIGNSNELAAFASDSEHKASQEDWLTAVTRHFKEGTVHDAVHAFRQLCIMKPNQSEHSSAVPPTAFALIAILNTLHKSPQQSETFLKALQEMDHSATLSQDSNSSTDGSNNNQHSLSPGKEHFHMVLRGWMGFDPPSAKRVEALVAYMEESAGIPYQLDSCNLVLQAWTKKQNAEGAQDFFDRMTSQKKLRPDLESCVNLLEAWSKSKSPMAAKRAEHLLSQMERWKVEPNVQCICHVIECWAKSKRKGAETQIESLMSWMYRQLEKEKGDDVEVQVVQDAMWNVLQAYQTIRNAHRAEEILLEYVEEYRHKKRFPPTLQMCNSVLTTWSKSKSTRRGNRAEKLLLMMETEASYPNPNIASYIAVLNCYASSNKPESAPLAEALLRRMERMDSLEPTLPAYTCVLVAWARSLDIQAAPSHAERIFQDVISHGLQPDRFVYSGLITAWGRSGREESIFKVEEYLQCIKDLDAATSRASSAKPTVVEYTAVLQAYANFVVRNVDRSRMVTERADSLLQEMLDSEDVAVRPNTLTYAAVLKVIAGARRLPDRGDRADAVLRVMQEEQVEISSFIMGIAKKCYVREPMQKQAADIDEELINKAV